MKSNYIKHPILEVAGLEARVVDALESIRREPWALETSVFGTVLHVMVENEDAATKSVRSKLQENGITAKSIQRITPSLEDVFLYLLEHANAKA